MIGNTVIKDSLSFIKHKDCNDDLQLKIGTLEGLDIKEQSKAYSPGFEKNHFIESCEKMIVRVKLDSRLTGNLLKGYGERTGVSKFNDSKLIWNQDIVFKDLPYSYLFSDVKFLFTIGRCDVSGQETVVGGTTLSLYHGSCAILRQGGFDLKVYPGVPPNLKNTEGDTSVNYPAHGGLMFKKPPTTGPDWLERVTAAKLEKEKNKLKIESKCMFLHVELKNFDADMLWWDSAWDKSNIQRITDWRIGFLQQWKKEQPEHNIYEQKHRMLQRPYSINPQQDKERKPNYNERKLLDAVLEYPPTVKFNDEEEKALWTFRYYLCSKKKGLAKLLRTIDWTRENEVSEAVSLLKQWSPPDALEAIELLGPSFTKHEVREYAVRQLSNASDNQLLICLLQLVQALAFESWVPQEINLSYIESKDIKSLDDSSIEKEFTKLQISPKQDCVCESPLAELLIKRAQDNRVIANYLNWYTSAEFETEADQNLKKNYGYMRFMKHFHSSLQNGNSYARETHRILRTQNQFVNKLVILIEKAESATAGRPEKEAFIRNALQNPQEIEFAELFPFPHPLNPEIIVTGINAGKTVLFKSATQPCLLFFKTESGSEYATIFKYGGDNLKQDEIIIQMITLMDELLQSENNNLQLTPYKVLQTGRTHGFVQYIESSTIQAICENGGTVQGYLREHGYSETEPYNISHKVMYNYVKSCAGYCVITYFLGIGDRHLENLLITNEGKMFHIDFGYILGNDPKPLAPPFKITRDMIDGMGGPDSTEFQDFNKYFFNAFLRLRRDADLIINLFSLLVDEEICASNLKKTVMENLEKKFYLKLGDEAVVKKIADILKSTSEAFVPVLMDQMHKIVQNLRR